MNLVQHGWMYALRTLISNKELKLIAKSLAHYIANRAHYWYKKTIQGWPIEKGSEKAIKLLKKIDFSEQTFIFMNLMEVHLPLFTGPGIPFEANFKMKPLDVEVITKMAHSIFQSK
jgi:hypothetical protein